MKENNIEIKIDIKKGILDHLLKREKRLRAVLDEIVWERSGVELDLEQLEKKLVTHKVAEEENK